MKTHTTATTQPANRLRRIEHERGGEDAIFLPELELKALLSSSEEPHKPQPQRPQPSLEAAPGVRFNLD